MSALDGTSGEWYDQETVDTGRAIGGILILLGLVFVAFGIEVAIDVVFGLLIDTFGTEVLNVSPVPLGVVLIVAGWYQIRRSKTEASD